MKKTVLYIAILGLIVIGLVTYIIFNRGMDMSGMDNSNMSGMDHSQMSGMNHNSSTELVSSKGTNEIAIPEVLSPDKTQGENVFYTIKAQQGTNGSMGYNGNLLGPVILLKKGQTVHLTEKNALSEATTVHLHGLIVPASADGGPHDLISSNGQKTVSFKVTQNAATTWFHPHAMGTTASQVYNGLAGLIYVNDEATSKLGLPNEYGKNDFPIILQDRSFNGDKMLSYKEAYNSDGTTGNTMLINGTLNPKITLPKEKVRLRLLNGSNARNMVIRLSNNGTFQQIASDGGLLPKPVSTNYIALTPGERSEVVIDFSKMNTSGLSLTLDNEATILPFKFTKSTFQADSKVPSILSDIQPVQSSGLVVTKKITLAGMMQMVSINGKTYDMNRIDLTQKAGVSEIWEIYNQNDSMGGMVHPFHIHGTQFRVISVNGKEPEPKLSGWKDTIALNPDDRVRILVKFDYPGIYMYHCHILEHEGNGMMGQIEVTK